MPFYIASVAFAREHTQLFNFIKPVAAALWNLRWQVEGYTTARPGVTEEELWQRFVQGSGIRSAGLRSLASSATWDEQLTEVARFALIGMTALYEGWCLEVVESFPSGGSSAPGYVKHLQFPSRYDASGHPTHGAKWVVAQLVGSVDPTQASFVTTLRRQRKYGWTEIDDLLRVYRVYKELRNSISHNNGRTSQRAVDAFADAATVPQVLARLRRNPLPKGTALDQPVAITLEDTMMFADIVARLVVTLDAELAGAPEGKDELVQRWRSFWATMPKFHSNDEARWPRQFNHWLRQASIPEATPPEPVMAFMRAQSLVREYDAQ